MTTHAYTRHCLRLSDNRSFVERVEMSGEQVAMNTRKSGDRADFIELINSWNRAGATNPLGSNGFIYVYVADAR